MKCSTTVEGKGLICMLDVGGEERRTTLELVCWYECELQLFEGKRGVFGTQRRTLGWNQLKDVLHS